MPEKNLLFLKQTLAIPVFRGGKGLYTHTHLYTCTHPQAQNHTLTHVCVYISKPPGMMQKNWVMVATSQSRTAGLESRCGDQSFHSIILFSFPKCFAMCMHHLFKVRFLKLSVILGKFLAAKKYFTITG